MPIAAALVLAAAAAAATRPMTVVDPPAATAEAPAAAAKGARILLDRASVGVTEAALSELTLPPGATLAEHVHPGATEIVHVVSGGGRLRLGDDLTEVGPGDTLVLPAGVVHGFTGGSEPTRAIQLYVPGGPEQRFRGSDGGAGETVPAAASTVADPGGGRVVRLADAPRREYHQAVYHFVLHDVRVDRDRRVDLLHIAEPAGTAADPHPHDGVSELTYILSGRGTVTIDGRARELRAGSAYYTPEGSVMGMSAEQALEALVLVVRFPVPESAGGPVREPR